MDEKKTVDPGKVEESIVTEEKLLEVNGGYDSPTIEEDGTGKKRPPLPPKDDSQRLY